MPRQPNLSDNVAAVIGLKPSKTSNKSVMRNRFPHDRGIPLDGVMFYSSVRQVHMDLAGPGSPSPQRENLRQLKFQELKFHSPVPSSHGSPRALGSPGSLAGVGEEDEDGVYGWLRNKLSHPDDDIDEPDLKIFVLLVHTFILIFYGVLTAGYSCAHALWPCLFTGSFIVLAITSMLHLCSTQRIEFARNMLLFGVTASAVGVHWVVGGYGHDNGVGCWAVLAPQFALAAGYAGHVHSRNPEEKLNTAPRGGRIYGEARQEGHTYPPPLFRQLGFYAI